MFKPGDIVRLNKWNDALTLNKYDCQSYIVNKIISVRGIFKECEIIGIDDNIKFSILDYRLTLDKLYYRRKKLEKICLKLEKK